MQTVKCACETLKGVEQKGNAISLAKQLEQNIIVIKDKSYTGDCFWVLEHSEECGEHTNLRLLFNHGSVVYKNFPIK